MGSDKVGISYGVGGSGMVSLKLTHEQEGNEGVRQVWVNVLGRINRTYKGPIQEHYT